MGLTNSNYLCAHRSEGSEVSGVHVCDLFAYKNNQTQRAVRSVAVMFSSKRASHYVNIWRASVFFVVYSPRGFSRRLTVDA